MKYIKTIKLEAIENLRLLNLRMQNLDTTKMLPKYVKVHYPELKKEFVLEWNYNTKEVKIYEE